MTEKELRRVVERPLVLHPKQFAALFCECRCHEPIGPRGRETVYTQPGDCDHCRLLG